MKKKKLSNEQIKILNSATREYWQIKKECFENGQWKENVSAERRKRVTELEETISSLNPDLLDFEKVPKSFLDYL
jgi:hypothetical protein